MSPATGKPTTPKGARNASAIGTAVERTSRFVLLTQITGCNGCTATHALQDFSRRFAGVIPELLQSPNDA